MKRSLTEVCSALSTYFVFALLLVGNELETAIIASLACAFVGLIFNGFFSSIMAIGATLALLVANLTTISIFAIIGVLIVVTGIVAFVEIATNVDREDMKFWKTFPIFFTEGALIFIPIFLHFKWDVLVGT